MAQHVLVEGPRARWLFTNKEGEAQLEEAQNFLRAAAAAGLPLACRALGQQDHCLQTLPPAHMPMSGVAPSVVAVLLHELDMTPVGCDGVVQGPAAEARRQWEYTVLEDVLEREGDAVRRVAARRMMAVVLGEGGQGPQPEHEVVLAAAAMAARLGLAAALLDMAACWKTLDLAAPVEAAWGGTALHVGALYGHAGVAEAMVCLGVAQEQRAAGGMSAGHVAAVAGHAGLLEYLQQHRRLQGLLTEEECVAGLTPRQLLVGVRAFAARWAVLTRSQILDVLLLPWGVARAAEVVRVRATGLGVASPKDLLQLSEAWLHPAEAMAGLEAEAQRLCGAVAAAGLPGTLVFVGRVLGDGNHLVMLYVLQDETLVTEGPRTLRQAFLNALTAAMDTLAATAVGLCPAPPFLTHTAEGAMLGYISDADTELQLLRLTLVPALHAEAGPSLTLALAGGGVEGTGVHVAPLGEGWACLPSLALDTAMERLPDGWRQAWGVCRFLNSLLKPPWWSPAHEAHHTTTAPIPEHALASVFLQQWAEEKEAGEQEGAMAVVQRAVQVFVRLVRGNFGSVWSAMDDLELALYTEIRPAPSAEVAEGIFLYLNDILQAAQKELDAPRVTFKDI